MQVPQSVRDKITEVFINKLSDLLSEETLREIESYVERETVLQAQNKGIINSNDPKLLYQYRQRMNILYQHLDINGRLKNKYLLPAIKSGKIPIRDLATMNEADMNPKHWKCAQQKAAEALQISHGEQASLTSLILCGKCGSKTKYTESQTRSSDEAMTVSVECPNCGNRFKL